MKKFISCLLILSFISCTLSACGTDTTETTPSRSTTETTRRQLRRTEPKHDLSIVDDSASFGDMNIEYDGTPWAEEHDLKFVNGDINTDYMQFLFNTSDNECSNSPTHTVETISKPVVISYPSDREGYVIYEVDYSIMLPIDITVEPDFSYYCSYYQSVRFLDYYTGYKYPALYMTENRMSFHVSGNVIYNGETYEVDFYQFREDEVLENSYSDLADGSSDYHHVTRINMTAYFVVPQGYDGMVMYADVSYQNMTVDEYMEHHYHTYNGVTETSIFGEGEDESFYDDYEFINIVELG